jgi:CheY-like chemotaxis protein
MNGRANILIVDDEKDVREGLQRILEKNNYDTTTVGSAHEALDALAGGPFDLVLTDLQMPGMDGMALLDEVKRRSPDVPVVMITAYGTMDIVIQALRQGVSDFVNKPFRADDLLTIVKREAARPQSAPSPDLPGAPVGLQLSPRQLNDMEQMLAQLRAETSARCVLLIESTGHLIEAKGIIDDLNVAALASLVAGDFAATSSIASLIGEGDAFEMNYHEGESYSVYSAQVAPQVFLLIIFGGDIKLGSVLYYARQAVPELKEIIEQGIVEEPQAAVPPMAPEKPQPAAPTSTPEELSPPVAAPAGESGSEELYSLDEVMKEGLLGDDVLDALDEQFANMWSSEM